MARGIPARERRARIARVALRPDSGSPRFAAGFRVSRARQRRSRALSVPAGIGGTWADIRAERRRPRCFARRVEHMPESVQVNHSTGFDGMHRL